VVEVHCNWPGSSDPYYLAAPTDNQARWTHYAISGVPAVSVDGYQIASWSSAATLVGPLMSDLAAIDLTVIPGDNIHVQVNVEFPISGSNNRLFVAVIEDSLYYPSAPNGEVWANNVLRKLLPSSSGQLVDLMTVGTQNFSFPLSLNPSWNTDNLQIVAWVQDMSAPTTAYNVHNAKVVEWRLMGYYHTFVAERMKELSSPGDTTRFVATIGNIGSYDDTYNIWFRTEVPAGWEVWAKRGTETFDSTGVTLASLADSDVEVFVKTSGFGGQGEVKLLLKSTGDTSGTIDTLTFTVMAGGDVLYIASQAAVTALPYFHDLFADNGVPYHEWSISRDGSLPDLSDAPYNAIVWHEGLNLEASLTLQDRTSIKNFLNNGGKMLVTSSSWARTVGSIFDFYYTHIGAISDGTESAPSSVTGTYGGTVFTGFSATLGGEVAEGFAVVSPSRGILRLSSGKTCGLIRDYDGGGKLVYVSFKLEDIANEASRDDFWARVVEYWGGYDVDEYDIPKAMSLVSAYPNPFNGVLTIEVSLETAQDYTIEAFDISGRLVETIYNGTVPAKGFVVRWETDDLPTGLYLVKVSGIGFSKELKNTADQVGVEMRIRPFLAIVMLVPIIAFAQGRSVSTFPDFTLNNMNGKAVTLSAVTAEGPAIVTFWATWCKPCVKELGKLEEMADFLETHNVTVLAVNEDGARTRAKVKPFVLKEGWSFEVLMDTNNKVKNSSGVAELPEFFIVGDGNEILYRHSGYKPGDEAEYREKIETLFPITEKE